MDEGAHRQALQRLANGEDVCYQSTLRVVKVDGSRYPRDRHPPAERNPVRSLPPPNGATSTHAAAGLRSKRERRVLYVLDRERPGMQHRERLSVTSLPLLGVSPSVGFVTHRPFSDCKAIRSWDRSSTRLFAPHPSSFGASGHRRSARRGSRSPLARPSAQPPKSLMPSTGSGRRLLPRGEPPRGRERRPLVGDAPRLVAFRESLDSQGARSSASPYANPAPSPVAIAFPCSVHRRGDVRRRR